MKLQNLTVIFIIILLPIILLVSLYITTGLKTIRYQALYDTGLLTATQDAIQAFETNTVNNRYSDNPEEKRSIIKSSIKMFETSLCNTCNISAYDLDEIEEYIPAIVFGMYDGFYLYAPSLNPETRKYEHSLKNYVYYSEILDEENAIVIRYYLDSYVQVSGYFGGKYESKEGYLINTEKTKFKNASGAEITPIEFYMDYQKAINDGDILTKPKGTISYYDTKIDINDEWAVNYFIDNYTFSNWFLNTANIDNYNSTDLDITREGNDPEDPNSKFVKHKNTIIRNKIEGVLNSTITAYSERTWGQNYKMPKLTEEDWERIYSDISVTTFFQGKRIGFTKYNGYCVLNSNNHYELINPNLLYFSTDDGGETTGTYDRDGLINSIYDYYHDIRCDKLPKTESVNWTLVEESVSTTKDLMFVKTLRGWKIGRFKKVKVKEEGSIVDTTGRAGTGPKLEYQDYNTYMYERAECACYECINGSVESSKTIYEYINIATDNWSNSEHASEYLTISYWTSLARERARLHEKDPEPDLTVKKSVTEEMVVNGGEAHYTIEVTNNAPKVERVTITDKVIGTDIIDIKSIEGCKVGTSSHSLTPEQLESTEGFSVDIGQGETLVIRYTANITDKEDSGTEVENEVKVSVVYEGTIISEPEWTQRAKCNTMDSDLSIAKSVNGEFATTIEYGTKVTYEINIRNEASVKDIINIRDVFYKEQITSVSNITITRADMGNGTIKNEKVILDDGTELGDTSRNWSNIDINPGETITIKYDAILKGDIGVDIINTAMVQSVLTGEAKWDKASATCKSEKTIKMQGSGGGDYHVILVLDSSTSMAGRIGEARSAARDLIYGFTDSSGNHVAGIGEDKVTIVSFSQSASVIDSLGAYQMIINGISTNYVAGLSVAQANLQDGVNNYVVFMSDGGPTNTQGPDTHWDGTNPAEILAQIGDAIGDIGEGFLAAILGGWIELNWVGVDDYNVRLLVGNIAEAIIEGIINLIRLPYMIATGNMSATNDDIISFAIGDIGLARSVWNYIMNSWVNPLRALTRQIYTVYFNTGGGNDPAYGLEQMASTGCAYRSDDTTNLAEDFQNITRDIQSFEVDEERKTENGVITLRLYEHITAIRVGTEEISASQLELIRNKITDNGDGSGNLNLRDPEISDIFKTNEEITVLY